MSEDLAPPTEQPSGNSSDIHDARVERALERTSELAERQPSEHVEIYDDVHRTLQEVLAQAAEDGPAGAAAGDGLPGGSEADSFGASQEDAAR